MIGHDVPTSSRLHDLLADRALFGLTGDEQRELGELLVSDRGVDPTSDLAIDRTSDPVADLATGLESGLANDPWGYERAVAAADLSVALADLDPLPERLRDRIEVDAVAFLAKAKGLTVVSPTIGSMQPSGRSAASADAASPAHHEGETRAVRSVRSEATPMRLGWMPWLLAAACLAVAAVAWWPSLPQDVASERLALLAAPGTQQITWSDTRDAGVSGDIVWNNEAQSGFMRFRGLAVNDATRMQYQLWIFDDARKQYSDNIAVDGGVFDIDRTTGDVVVPIRAKLPVSTPSLFAVTTEPPGGVVKHNAEHDPDRFKIILTAAPSS